MRVLSLICLGLLLTGCGRIDSNRTTSEVDATPPKISVPDQTSHPSPNNLDKPVEPDNTAVNARDTNRVQREPKLPIDQKENQGDIDITAKIRQGVVNAEGLSTNAKNVKIITADGHVTLRGPVDSKTEHDSIVTIAHGVAGKDNVVDQIEVKDAGEDRTAALPNK